MQQLNDQNNQTDTENDQTVIEDISSSQQPSKFSVGDGLFLGFITTGLVGGVTLTLLSLPALAPSLFFSLAVSSLVHRYLGGIRSADASITTGIGRLGGTLASLVLTAVIFNSILEKQMNPVVVTVDPKESDLVVLDRNTGKALDITIKGENGLKSGQKPIQVNSQALNYIKRLCRQGEGFCKESTVGVEFVVNPKLKPGLARVCAERSDLNGYPLMVWGKETPGSKTASGVSRITAYAELNCPPDRNNNLLLVEISQEDAVDANVSSGSEGKAFMTSLGRVRPESLLKDGAERSQNAKN